MCAMDGIHEQYYSNRSKTLMQTRKHPVDRSENEKAKIVDWEPLVNKRPCKGEECEDAVGQ